MTVAVGRHTARIEGDFVVFLIGLRINRPWLVHRWMPIGPQMVRMLAELARQPELGLLGSRTAIGWGGPLLVQYWRTFEQLEAYARDTDAAHLPAWRRFNQLVRASPDVGIWHETYRVAAGEYEAMYVNMPTYGLGAAGTVEPVGSTSTAAGRLGDRAGGDAPVDGY